MKKKLDPNYIDLVTKITKSAVGTIPIAGPFLSEVVSTIIPHQRIDRVSKYLEELDKRLNVVEENSLIAYSNNDYFIDLVEESFIQASRALSDERRSYIARIVCNSITSEEISLQESKQYLKLLYELNDIEIILLQYYNLIGSLKQKYYIKHKEVLDLVTGIKEIRGNRLSKRAIQTSYSNNLLRLQLIEVKFQLHHRDNTPLLTRSGKPRELRKELTFLGKALLKEIGLSSTIDDTYF